MKALYSTARSLDESAILYRRSLDENTIQQVVKEQVVKEQVVKEQVVKEQVVKEQVVKEQVVKEQVVRATTTVDNSLKKKRNHLREGHAPPEKVKSSL